MSEAYTVSEISARSPDMSDGDFRVFVENIRQNGQLVPIWVRGSEVIDGRKRLAACQQLGVEPRIINIDPLQDAESVARALNVLRTHYTPSQRAAFAADRANATKGDFTKERISKFRDPGIRTSAEVAREVGVARSAVDAAKRVAREGAPEVTAAIKSGKLTLHAATEIVKLVPKDEQPAAIEKVITASRGKAKHTPVAKIIDGIDPRKDRAIRKPAHEQFARAMSMMDVASGVIAETINAVMADMRRRKFVEILRQVRTTISRVITDLEKVA